MDGRFDILIKHGEIVDGTGRTRYQSDLGVTDGRIAAIASDIPVESASQVMDAQGLVVSPGFIDTHSHDDFLLIVRPEVQEKVLQGVTTVIIGNCGIGVAPLTNQHETFIRGMLGGFGGDYLADDYVGISSLGEYFRHVQNAKPSVNVASLVGHINVRFSVMGLENRDPSPDELQAMKRLVAEAMQDGALGLSTGLAYPPGGFAKTEEIIELAREAALFYGIYTSHLRSEADFIMDALAETARVGAEAGLPVHVSHHKLAGRRHWGKSGETLGFMAQTREAGTVMTCDQYPYRAGSTFLSALIPPQYLAGGTDALSRSLADTSVRKEIIQAIEGPPDPAWENLVDGAGFDNIIISSSSKHPDYLGMSLAAIAERDCKSAYDAMFDLLADEAMQAGMIMFTMSEDDVVRIMQNPFTMVGSDGIPGFGFHRSHPRMTGTFPRVLGRYVREQGVLSLEEAIRKMTSLPAKTFGLSGKGELREGYDADVVVFDPQTVRDGSTFDEPDLAPVGIEWVMVNGYVASERGNMTGAASGQVIRR